MGRILDLKPDEVLPPKIEEDVPVKKFEPDLDKSHICTNNIHLKCCKVELDQVINISLWVL